MKIEDLSVNELELYVRTSEVGLRRYFEPEPGLFVAESEKVIRRAIDAGYEPVSFLAEESREALANALSEGYDVPVYTAQETLLRQLLGYELTGGLLCAMRRKALPKVSDVIAGARRVAVLCEVTNPTNVGAIFRSAAALGMDAVLLTGGCSDPLYRRAARVSMGTVFQIPWTYLPASDPKLTHPDEPHTKDSLGRRSPAWLSQLSAAGFLTVAMALQPNALSIEDIRLREAKRAAILMGNEGNGLPLEVIRACDYIAAIPMTHGVDSLNVAAASAVVFWELRIESKITVSNENPLKFQDSNF